MDNRGRKKTFNKSEVSKIKLPSVGAWLTNTGKSIGMATMDIIEDVLPATSELAGTVGEYGQTIKDLFKQVRNAKPSEGGMVSKYIDIGKEAINNTKADLKSGKLYHSMNDVYNEMNGDEFGDIDFGDDFDDDFSDDDYDAEFYIVKHLSLSAEFLDKIKNEKCHIMLRDSLRKNSLETLFSLLSSVNFTT